MTDDVTKDRSYWSKRAKTDEERWQIRYVRAATNIRAAPLALFIATDLGFLWFSGRELTVLPGFMVGLSPLLIIAAISQFRRRVPGTATLWAETDPQLPKRVSGDSFKITVRIEQGRKPNARVIGGIAEPVVLITRATQALWRSNEEAREVQWAHESAHIAMGDSVVYHFLAAGLAFVSLDIAIRFVKTGSFDLVYMVGPAVALICFLSYARSRELAADFFSAVVLGDAAKDAIVRQAIPDGRRVAFLSNQPSLKRRLEAFDDPTAGFKGLGVPYFGIGLFAVAAAVIWTLVSEPSTHMSALLTTFSLEYVVALFVAKNMSIGNIFRPGEEIRWCLAVSAGIGVGLTLVEPSKLTADNSGVLAAIAIGSALLVGACLRGVTLVAGILVVLVESARASSIARIAHWLVVSVLVLTLWVGPSYYWLARAR